MDGIFLRSIYKELLARVMQGTIDEFKNLNEDEIIDSIIDGPFISSVSNENGKTNNKIRGLNTESIILGEGSIFFDVLFYARIKSIPTKIIINIELQKDNPSVYELYNRSVFYLARLISSQKGREFDKQKYDKMINVYSIWIQFYAKENYLTRVRLTSEDIYGKGHIKIKPDLANIVYIGVPEFQEGVEIAPNLNGLLTTIFSDKLKAKEKVEKLEKEFNFSSREITEEKLNDMCNISDGIYERGIKEGKYLGKREGKKEGIKEMIISFYNSGMSKEEISTRSGKSLEYINSTLASN